MVDHIKTKLQAALALLGALFALRPYLDDLKTVGFAYLDLRLTLLHAIAVMAALLAVTVHCYAIEMIRERPFSLIDRLGNSSFALAVLVTPTYGLGYGLATASAELAKRFEMPHLEWAGPATVAGLVVVWLLSAVLLRRRLTKRDHQAQFEKLTETESAALKRAQEMFDHEHYDLSVIEVWRGLEARLRRALLIRSVRGPFDDWASLRDAANSAGLLAKVPLTALDELRRHWLVAVGVEPLPRPAAEAALVSARRLLATIPL